jgi:hypothetical protein
MPRQSISVILALFVLAIRVSAQTLGDRELERKQLDRLESQFLKEQKLARDAAAARFDALIAAVSRNPNLSGSERVSNSKIWAEEKELFVKYEQLSPRADLAELGLEYGLRVNAEYRPLAEKYEQLITAATRRKDMKIADELLTAKQKFDTANLPGRREFAAGTVWEGQRHGLAATVPFRLAIRDLTGSVFRGRVEVNFHVTGHPIFEIRGTIDGTRLQLTSTEQLQGRREQVSFDGVTLGKTILLEQAGVRLVRRGRRGRGDARPTGGYVVLEKR